MKHERRDEEVWTAQQEAWRRLSAEQRVRQNDSMSRVRVEGDVARKRAARG